MMTQWDFKDKKEKPYMLFGSLCNYFGRIHAKTGKEMKEQEIIALFKLCCKMANDHIDQLAQPDLNDNSQPPIIKEETDLPL